MATDTFLSTLSLRRATWRNFVGRRKRYFISIHALLAESDVKVVEPGFVNKLISIHALLAESDYIITGAGNRAICISIHALLAESDTQQLCPAGPRTYFYPRSPCGERQAGQLQQRNARYISIHALLAESDEGRVKSL